MVDLASLPAEVRALIEAQAATIVSQSAELVAHRVMMETLRLQLARLRRTQFGRSSEKLDAEIAQLTLALEDLEAGIARKDASAARSRPSLPTRPTGSRRAARCRSICRA